MNLGVLVKKFLSCVAIGMVMGLLACSSGGPAGASISEVYVPEDVSTAIPDWLDLGTDSFCEPACEFKQCGPDGCGGVCGKCLSGQLCDVDFQCVACTASCDDKKCGDDGCGGSCGQCGDGEHCAPDYVCRAGACSPGQSKCDEDGKITFCLGDGSDWSYPVPCPDGEKCQEGQCVPEQQVCNPGEVSCDGTGFKTCLADGSGWGETIGCPEGTKCEGGKCQQVEVQVNCESVLACMMLTKCGDPEPTCMDECFVDVPPDVKGAAAAVYACFFGSCDKWGPGEGCFQIERITTCATTIGACKNQCAPSCADKECGNDGCGGSCGQCQVGFQCAGGHCTKDCTPDCQFKQCGNDGCDGSCGTCEVGFTCSNGHCIKDCSPACAGNECGGDGCGGQCGTCQPGFSCKAGKCEKDCISNCTGKECGGDGCGGSCGNCGPGASCKSGKCESNDPCGGISFEGCCDGQILKYCAEGKVYTENCAGKPQCGWKFNSQYYDCGTSGNADPSGNFPKACSGVCTPACGNKVCGSDGCGGSCGNCQPGFYCTNGVCFPDAGGDSCNEVVECVFGCVNFECYNSCKGKGDAQAQDIFAGLEMCILQHCGFEFNGQCLWDAVTGPCEEAYDECSEDV